MSSSSGSGRRRGGWIRIASHRSADMVDDMPLTSWRLPPLVLPDGDEEQLWVAGEHLTSVPVDGAAHLPGRFTLPGLVDAHAHLALTGSEAGDATTVATTAQRFRDMGVLLVRDLGAPRSVTLDV